MCRADRKKPWIAPFTALVLALGLAVSWASGASAQTHPCQGVRLGECPHHDQVWELFEHIDCALTRKISIGLKRTALAPLPPILIPSALALSKNSSRLG